ncbi:MAG: tRNA 2-thiocytidine biosynthesis protein TtcA [Syntrophorhabdus sp. PtaB.Bin006]|nr:MAG: tRNA 2-thiocytidine biosynthesis protein TtcA [Syntrophorhabdus sp. PtaB.Bin006]
MNASGPFYFMTKKVGKAIWDYRMLKEGDKVLVAVSGGKDSLCLIKIMKERIKFVPITYEIVACYVDMGFPWVDKEALVDYLQSESIPYVIAQPPEEWKGDSEPFGCFWCSWNRRKALFDLAHELKCNKIAFAHHMDDIIETMLLNLFFQGEIGTMQPYQEMFDGELAIIRPLAYVEEKELLRLATKLQLPVSGSDCPHGKTSKRFLVKGLITELKKHNRNVKKNIFRSLQRVREEYLLATPKNEPPSRSFSQSCIDVAQGQLPQEH